MNAKNWQVFKEYGIYDVDMLVKHCLQSLVGQDVRSQLRTQNVVRIEREPLLCTGGMKQHLMDNNCSGFDIILNDTNSNDDDISTVAHEIGHTFEACHGGSYLKSAGCDICRARPEFADLSERFAETFGQNWLADTKNRLGLTELLRQLTASRPLRI